MRSKVHQEEATNITIRKCYLLKISALDICAHFSLKEERRKNFVQILGPIKKNIQKTYIKRLL